MTSVYRQRIRIISESTFCIVKIEEIYCQDTFCHISALKLWITKSWREFSIKLLLWKFSEWNFSKNFLIIKAHENVQLFMHVNKSLLEMKYLFCFSICSVCKLMRIWCWKLHFFFFFSITREWKVEMKFSQQQFFFPFMFLFFLDFSLLFLCAF